MRLTMTIISITLSTNLWADPNAAKQKASSCFACHGPNGVSPNPVWPNLAGQKERYLFEQLQAFKSGQRLNALMTPQAKMLDEQDMHDLAHYFSELKATP